MKNKPKKVYVRPPSEKMLKHLARVHKLIRARTAERRKAAEAKKAKARARYAARKSQANPAPQPSATTS